MPAKFNHVMLDLETLSTRTDACIIQIAAIAFDIETGELGPRFNAYVNESRMIGEPVGHIDPQTVGWWMRQKFAATMGDMLTDEDEAQCLSEALGGFAEWFTETVGEDDTYTDELCLWAHGATFDLPILQNAYQQRCPEVHEGKVPWHYRAPRDTRTLFDLAPGGMPRPFKDETREHDAQYDCEYRIAQVVEAWGQVRLAKAAYTRHLTGMSEVLDRIVALGLGAHEDEQGGTHSTAEAAVPASPYPFASQEALNEYAAYAYGETPKSGADDLGHTSSNEPGFNPASQF